MDFKEKMNATANAAKEKANKFDLQGTVDAAKSKAENFDVKATADKAKNKVETGAKKAGYKMKDTMEATKTDLMKRIDQNGDGVFDSVDIILAALKVPGVKIDRSKFLNTELSKKYSKEVVNKAIEINPSEAGVSVEDIDKIADEIIKFERITVSGISTALGVPGGAAMVATIPTDIAQYYGCMLRVAQKLLYLYGFPEINIEEESANIDTETINNLTICLGVMYGVANANKAIQAMAQALAKGVEKELIKKALTKGTIYPFVKSVAKWFGVKMTKEVFAGFFKKSIPVIGGVIGGGLTYATFKPCCDRLKEALQDTYLSNPDHESSNVETEIFESIKNGTVVDITNDVEETETEVTQVDEEFLNPPKNSLD